MRVGKEKAEQLDASVSSGSYDCSFYFFHIKGELRGWRGCQTEEDLSGFSLKELWVSAGEERSTPFSGKAEETKKIIRCLPRMGEEGYHYRRKSGCGAAW